MKNIFTAFLFLSLVSLAQGQTFTLPHDHSANGKGGTVIAAPSLTNVVTINPTGGQDITIGATGPSNEVYMGVYGSYYAFTGSSEIEFGGAGILQHTGASFAINSTSAANINMCGSGCTVTTSNGLITDSINSRSAGGITFEDTITVTDGVNDVTISADSVDITKVGVGDGVFRVTSSFGGNDYIAYLEDDALSMERNSSTYFYVSPTALNYTGSSGILATSVTVADVPVNGNVGDLKLANESRDTTATVANDSELAGYVLPVGQYSFDALLLVDSASATPNFDYRLNCTGGSIDKFNLAHFETTTSTIGNTRFSTAITVENRVDLDGTNEKAVKVNGGFRVNTSDATCSLQWAQGTSDATATTLNDGSYLNFQKLN